MKQVVKKTSTSSEFINLAGIEYFNFEEDFVEDNVRCIPMIVRFKLDGVGIKLKLAEWVKFTAAEKVQLAVQSCQSAAEIQLYRIYLQTLILSRSGTQATELPIDLYPGWCCFLAVPPALLDKAATFGWKISIHQWKALTNLQRFALLKLCRPGHEDKNFPKAMIEFKLVKNYQEFALN